MRTFSALRRDCNYPEIIDLSVAKTPSRQKSMGVGTEFHSALEAWVTNQPLGFLLSKDANKWFEMMAKVWNPPADCETEIAIGITNDGRAVEVDEPEPHVYVPREPGIVLLTAGRLDLLWNEEQDKKPWLTRVVVDAKTGRTYLGDPWQIPQLVAQAVAVALSVLQSPSDTAVTQIKLGVYYARLGVFDYGDGPRSVGDVAAMLPMVHRWALADSDPKPGAHCLGCYSATNCHASPMKAAG